MKIIGISGGSGNTDRFIRSGVDENYVKAVQGAGAVPLILPICQDQQAIEEMVKICDGIVLSGGVDIHPRYYHEEILQACGEFDVYRDQFEITLLTAAKKWHKPILGICRGAQMINVFYGGSLYQDLSLNEQCYVRHSQQGSRGFGSHSIQVMPNTFLASLYQDGDLVNSYHHQAVKQLAEGFRIAALSADGIVEAYEHLHDPIYAVQFHPEVMIEHDEKARQLFAWFVERIEA